MSVRPEMKRLGLRLLAIVVCVLACSCQSSTSPSATGYAGQWSGTTAQGRAVAFTISSAENVTAITIGHDFNGCAGSETYSSLSLSIAPTVQCIPAPCPPGVLSYRGFGYGTGNRIDEPSVSINAVFLSNSSAQGTLNFRNFPGCGDAIGVSWSAAKR